MPHWQNWSGKQRSKVDAIHFARSVDDIAAVVTQLSETPGKRLRVAGAGHSHAPLVVGADQVLDISGLSGVIATDAAHQRAKIWGGTPIYMLGRTLHDQGLALRNQGDIDRQFLAGACATGTHGSGRQLQNLSASIESMTLVDGAGQSRICSKATLGDDFEALKVGLGAFGVVTEIELNLRPAFKLREQSNALRGAEVLENLETLSASGARFEFFWQPRKDTALVKTLQETSDPPVYPIGEEGERCGWNFEVLPNHRPHLHTEMEYSVAAEDGPKCFAEIRDLLLHRFTDVQWPVEYRTLARDDGWLSNAFERETVTISVHEDVRNDERAYYQACEAVFKKYQGRPHWGKVHYGQGADFMAQYPRWLDWWRLRDTFDPAGCFLNDFLTSVRPPKAP